MPSTHSTSVLRVLPSSTVMTPSLPTFSVASAIILPISESKFEATVATCSVSVLVVTLVLILWSCSTMSATALSIPRFISMGLTPATTALRPSL